MASNPNQPAPPGGYQPGVGAPVNQQYLGTSPEPAQQAISSGAQSYSNPPPVSSDGRLSAQFSSNPPMPSRQAQFAHQQAQQPYPVNSSGPPAPSEYHPQGQHQGQTQPYFPPSPGQAGPQQTGPLQASYQHHTLNAEPQQESGNYPYNNSAPSQVPQPDHAQQPNPPPYHPDPSFPPPPMAQGVPQYSAPSQAGPYNHQAPEKSELPQFGSGNVGNAGYVPPLPPRRQGPQYGDDDPSNPVHYTRDPHKLVAYIVPFPKPVVKGVQTAGVPDRFLIYTPPPPPLSAPPEGVKEDKMHKVQRKWQEEVRSAKTSDAKTASWKGVKGKATKGINYVMSNITSSSLDFVNRIPGGRPSSPGPDTHHDDGKQEGDETHRTVGLDEMVLVYPSSYHVTPDQMRIEFVNSLMRTRSKAQKDAVLATGLLPVSAAIDILATMVWPFGGLLEVDGVWAYSSIRGAKTARSVTKRLTSTGTAQYQGGDQELQGEKLHLNFVQSPRLEVLDRYLAARCAERNPSAFPRVGLRPTEMEVLNAIGWAPSQRGLSEKNWEDEQWETEEVKDDMRLTLGKAAKEWDRWCQAFEKNPEKALKK